VLDPRCRDTLDATAPTSPRIRADGGAVLRFADYPIADLVERIDWTPFFHTWELRGKFPAIFDDPAHGAEARKLFDDAEAMLTRIVAEGWLEAGAVAGLWPANAVGDDVELYTDETGSEILTTFHFLRQQGEKREGVANHCLADFIAPRSAGKVDYLGAFAVTAGLRIEDRLAHYTADHDDYHGILLKALADRLAEAFAERLHERVRREFWGYAPDEALPNTDLIKEAYRGIRPAHGYPACPDHTEKDILWALIRPDENVGIRLTESKAMIPAASVSGLYFSHPAAKYFMVGKVGRDQVEDYARRKAMTVTEMERWLAPVLGYDPG
jgi:5-methyltetrahydrofolate--homocysteine methyltransferase